MTRASSLTDWTWVRVKSIGTLGGAVLFLVESLGVTIADALYDSSIVVD